MRRAILWTVGFLGCANLARAQMISPKDFAYEQLAITAAAAPAYRFSLPLNVYQNTFHEDLADLRVFNADGIAVPFSLSRPAAQALIHKAPVALPLFPLFMRAPGFSSMAFTSPSTLLVLPSICRRKRRPHKRWCAAISSRCACSRFSAVGIATRLARCGSRIHGAPQHRSE